MAIIVPSILSADLTRLGDELSAIERAGADWIHVDVMDGHFVPNLTMGPMTVEAVHRVTALPIDVHLMIDNPDQFIETFATAGATHISIHAEAARHLNASLQTVRSCGAHPGIALGPATPLSFLEWSLDFADYVLLIAVNPGFGGQEVQPAALGKIRALRAELARRGLATIVESDGGINDRTIGDFAAAGVDAFVAGSGIFGTRDYAATITRMRQEAERGRASGVLA
ncbi:MAG TPA: ribulose-phosphate 3-epimerase [Spirochaetia bacterium]|nr:ribulose-phosphate 3-epimerase [Spirochaetia bacterium]